MRTVDQDRGPEPVFYYDFNSPYAYLAATRVDRVVGSEVRWSPIAFAFLLSRRGRVPWSLVAETRGPGMRECEERARRYGLPTMRWPPGWPRESYSLAPLRAALVAAERGRLREFSLAAFERNFVSGEGLRDEADLAPIFDALGLEPQTLAERIGEPTVKERLRINTEEALAAGVVGVPTVVVGGQAFWGDDRLEDVAAAIAGLH